MDLCMPADTTRGSDTVPGNGTGFTADGAMVSASRPLQAAPDERVLRLAMVGWPVAGIRTHGENVQRVIEAMPGVATTYVDVDPWKAGGRIERLALLPPRLRSTVRTFAGTAPLFQARSLDVVWSQVLNPLAPFLFTKAALSRLPVVYDIDCTPRLLASFGQHYAEQIAGAALKRRIVDTVFGAAARQCAAIIAWSGWAARSFMDDYGVARSRVRVIPPGVDLEAWAPSPTTERNNDRVRLLFVGGDFARKGGDLLLEVWRQHFAERCDLHVVTRETVTPQPGLFVYRDFTPNAPGLRQLYHTCDALVLPTRGDCFSLASLEAMAVGLPVITTAVGGIPDIVEDGGTGFLLAPDDGAALRTAIETLVDDAALRDRMGAAGRRVVEERFDAAQNTRRLLDVLRHVAARAI